MNEIFVLTQISEQMEAVVRAYSKEEDAVNQMNKEYEEKYQESLQYDVDCESGRDEKSADLVWGENEFLHWQIDKISVI